MQVQAEGLHDEIIRLKKKTDTIILAHNYQVPAVQDVADLVGDSLGLARKAGTTSNSRILFCGVHFMAETASIISPEKRVLIPDPAAGCSLSDSITLDDLRRWKKQHPGAVSVGYVNTTAEIKAELDYCCTSSNAAAIVESIPKDREVLFLPDMFLGSYVAKATGRKNMFIWPGECHVHAGITPEDVQKRLDSMQDAEFVVHPECSCTTPMLHDIASGAYKDTKAKILSTEGMMKHVAKSDTKNFVVGTETGILYRMRKENPDKTFLPASDKAECQFMKMITPEKVRDSLLYDKFEVSVPPETARKARRAIERMLEVG
ncbi:quinolinate synthase [Cenarchaeum symbiosum A]|uniref:Quinolinate synthase n=1 Tax=Cenarchaeum symbiosum (strain A) TaxID=414004 RepID=A0RW75_CENSY|nr:quinolinate synthase [Cenarchaeum symbiosum A]